MKKNFVKNMKTAFATGLLCLSLSVPTLADNNDNYIVFLPVEENVTYDIDEAHYSEKYSTDDYTILLYRPGEVVRVNINGNPNYSIQDAIENTNFDSLLSKTDNNVTFIMPEKDLSFVFNEQETQTEAPAEESETPAESTEAPTESSELPEETATEAESTEAATEQEAPQQTGSWEAGHIKVKVAADGTAKAIMPGGGEEAFAEDNTYDGTSVMDLIRVYSNSSFNSDLTVNVYKNGELLTDTSGVIINKGRESSLFTVDVKNTISLDGEGYEIQIIEPGHEAELFSNNTPETETETQAAETEAIPSENPFLEDAVQTEETATEAQLEETTTETDSNVEVTSTGDNEFSINLNIPETEAPAPETESVATEVPSTEAAATETEAVQEQAAPETELDIPEFEAIVIESTEEEPAEQTEAVSQTEAVEQSNVQETVNAVNTASDANISITNGLDAPVVIIYKDGSVSTLEETNNFSVGIAGIEVMSKFDEGTKPCMVVRRNGVLDDIVVATQELLANGHYYFEFDDALNNPNDIIKITIA